MSLLKEFWTFVGEWVVEMSLLKFWTFVGESTEAEEQRTSVT